MPELATSMSSGLCVARMHLLGSYKPSAREREVPFSGGPNGHHTQDWGSRPPLQQATKVCTLPFATAMATHLDNAADPSHDCHHATVPLGAVALDSD